MAQTGDVTVTALKNSTAPYLNVLDPAFAYESAAVAEAQREGWYARMPGGIMVLHYRQGREILRDRRFQQGGRAAMDNLGIAGGPFWDFWMAGLTGVPPDDHARLRGLVNPAFAPVQAERLAPFARSTAERLAASIAPGRECEFVAAFAEPLAVLVMCEMLGVPPEDQERFHRCSSDIALAFTRKIGDLLPRVDAAVIELTEYVRSLLADRRGHLGSDLISSLIAAEQAGDRLTEEELQNLVLQLVWAGQDTTARQLGRALVAFAECPGQWEILGARPELAAQAVDEVVRWTPQSRSPMRYPVEDVVYNDLLIPQGTACSISTVACNRDPDAFENPGRFDITVPRRHRPLTFGGGVHQCLGEAAAWVEMAEALSVLAGRLGPPSITGEVIWRPAMARIHGPDVLPLCFAARA